MDIEMRHKKIIEIVQDKLTCSAHNLDHVFRVYKLCLLIAKHEKNVDNEPNTIEAKILFDSDKLDVIGASGIARTFMLAGQFGQRLTVNESMENYLKGNTVVNGRIKDVSKHTPFIEYEIKFKKIPDKLHTDKAKEIGRERLKFMDQYFSRLSLEIEGIN
jgi:uncharacterized protein